MDTKDREAIEGLFSKLGDVERQSGARDREAEAYIGEQLARNPGAPYYMAQTIVMQEVAIGNQARELEELRRQVESLKQGSEDRGQQNEGGFLSRILGGGSSGRGRTSVPITGRGDADRQGDVDRQDNAERQGNPWGGRGGMGQASPSGGGFRGGPGAPMSGFGGGMGGGFGGGGMGGGGFLAGAAQTAMGVAGGVMLGQALGGLFGGSEAKAATPAADTEAAAGGGGADQTADAAPADTTPADDNGTAGDGGVDNASYGDAPADDGGDWGGGDGGGFDDI